MWSDKTIDRTVAAFNFSGVPVKKYRINLPCPMELLPLISSDTDIYGGSSPESHAVLHSRYDAEKEQYYVELDFAPYSGMLYQAVPVTLPKAPPRKKAKKKGKR